MWVSVLVLGAAEHPVPHLSGPPYPLLVYSCQLPDKMKSVALFVTM